MNFFKNQFSNKKFYDDKTYFKFQTAKELSKANIKQKYFQFPTGFTVLILTNVAWDTTMLISKPNVIFKNHTDWFLKLINFFKKHRHINVIIRPHPLRKFLNVKIISKNF